ncbi:MAG: sigma-70 family RNA polymerase sigma factor [Pirellula sp.]
MAILKVLGKSKVQRLGEIWENAGFLTDTSDREVTYSCSQIEMPLRGVTLPNEWTEFVDSYGPMVYRCAWRVLRNQHDAEDIVQDVFSYAWDSVEFANVKNKAGWLRCVTVRRSLNCLRRRKPLEFGEIDVACKRSRESKVESAELHTTVRLAIANLPEQQRLAFSLRYFEEMSNTEIANELGTTLSAVSSALHSARQTLARILAPAFKGD